MKKPRIVLSAFIFSLILLCSVSAHAKDEWIQVKSKNFFLVGNASEKDIRKVGTRLEEFRETFRLLFTNMNLVSPISTNVIVFKSESAYKPFKPKRQDGKTDNFVAGFFQPGQDVNYITLSTEGEDEETFAVIFHEYVHSIVNINFGKSEVPAWFNEGLAEYFSTFSIQDDQKVKLGLPLSRHLSLLQQSKLTPLQTLLNVSGSQLLETGDHSRSIFYAESWALIHYFMQSGKSGGLGKYLAMVLKDVPPEKAFQEAFQMNYASMEAELRKYVSKNSYQYNEITLKNKLTFDADMRVSPLDESTANAYLGDLLFHNHREDDAEPFLLNALKGQPNSSMANTTLGMVKLNQRKFDEAKKYLESAISDDQKNHMAFYRYAYLLSREGRDEFGYTQKFDKDTAAKMREALRKAISINPSFTDSYELLAFVDVVNNEELDDAASLMTTALKYQPGNQRYALRIADIYMRQNKFDEAIAIAEKIARTAEDAESKNRASEIQSQIAMRKNINEQNAAERKRYEDAMAGRDGDGGGPRMIRRIETDKEPTEAEKKKMVEDATLRSINEALRKTGTGEQRVQGHIQKIDCKKSQISYTIKSDAETFAVTSIDFNALVLNALDPAANNAQVGCDANLSAFTALVTYKTSGPPKIGSRGELIAIEFVPANFRPMTEQDLRGGTYTVYPEGQTGQQIDPPARTIPQMPSPEEREKMRKDAMMRSLKDMVHKPGDGEKRELGFLEKIECTSKAQYFYIRTPTQVLKLLTSQATPPKIVVFTQDLEGVQFGCTLKPIEFPSVVVYKDAPDNKAKSAGTILSLDFVPKSFVLD